MAESFYNNGTDVIVICASVFAFLIMLSRIIYKSKCKNISCCWNCINIDRNVEIETDIIPDVKNNNIV